ncbi:MAG: energy transducer TonB [Flavobacteriaceae bacterium]|nr:energy transducer TonB [Flavobacteriaceae bacterium]
MKAIALVLFFLLFSSVSFAQIGGEDEVYLSGDRTDPTFNGGGLDKFYDFINKEFDFSKVKKAGKMITAFTIDVDGAIKNIKVIQFVDVETATEIIRVLKKAPKWEPAKRGGKPISIEIKLPLDFKVSN